MEINNYIIYAIFNIRDFFSKTSKSLFVLIILLLAIAPNHLQSQCSSYTASIALPQCICTGDMVPVTFYFSGGTSPYDVTWSVSNVTQPTLYNIEDGHTLGYPMSNNYAQFYKILSVIDANGCVGTPALEGWGVSKTDSLTTPAPINGTENPCLNQNYVYSTPISCVGYYWSVPPGGKIIDGETNKSITIRWDSTFVSGNICLVVINSCSASPDSCRLITRNPNSLNVSLGTSPICSSAPVILDPGSFPSSSYKWSNNATTNTITASSSGNYIVTVTQNGCSSTASVMVNIQPPISINNIVTNPLAGSFNISGGSPQITGTSYSVVEMQLENNPLIKATLDATSYTHGATVSFTTLVSGNYLLTVADETGCSATASITVPTDPANTTIIAPCIKWQRTLGGSLQDIGFSSIVLADSSSLILGGTYSNDGNIVFNHGDSDAFISKLDPEGNILWQKTFGGTLYDACGPAQPTSDGGYIVAGDTYSNNGDVTGLHGERDIWLFKLNATGNLLWQKCLGGSGYEFPTAMQPTSDGNFIICGISNSNNGDVSGNQGSIDYWILKITPTGTILWQRTYGGSGEDFAQSIVPTPDGGYIIAGHTNSNDGDVSGNHGGRDFWLVKIKFNGGIQWKKCFGGSGDDFAWSVQTTSDGGYIVTGKSDSNDGDVSQNHGLLDYWVIKLDISGNLIWQKTFGGSGNDFASNLIIDNENFVVVGGSSSFDGDVSGNHGDSDTWIIKLDPAGNLLWGKCLGGTWRDEAFSVNYLSPSHFLITNWTSSLDGDVMDNHGHFDVWVAKMTVEAPECVPMEFPAHMSSGNPTNTSIHWQKPSVCISGYRLFLSTTPGANDMANNLIVFDTVYQTATGFAPGDTVFVRIIPFNDVGIAGICQEYWFATAPLCTTVTTNADSGPGSFREAINCANSNPGPDTIRFNIPGAGPHVIALQTGLPVITDSGTIIDGSTQPQGKIVIDGSAMSSGEIIYASDCNKTEIYGLILKNSAGSGIALANSDSAIIGAPGKGNIVYGSGRLDAPYPYDFVNFANNYNPDIILFNCTNSKVQSNQVGITENGGLPTRPVAYGITVSGQNNLIGGNRSADEGNVVGNCYHGASTWDLVGNFPQTDNIRFYGNNIGTGFAGTEDFGNVIGTFTYNEVANVRIGNSPDQANIFKFNDTGIRIGGTGFGDGQVRINQNTFSCNTVGALVETNPAHPLAINMANTSQVSGTSNAGDIVEVYKSEKNTCPAADCQGTTFLGQTTADNTGNWALSGIFSMGEELTASATSLTGGWTYGFSACRTVQASNCNPVNDSLALVQLYNFTNGDSWTTKTNWKSAQPIGSWHGVTVASGGCISEINLDNNNLNGTIPPTLGNLTTLSKLILRQNPLLTGGIPPELGSLQQLETLLLDFNNLTGVIPDETGNLTNLKILWLGNNAGLGGMIPNTLSSLTHLEYFALQNCQFSGALPSWLGNFSQLQNLSFQHNQFDGVIPASVGNLLRLKILWLGDNQLNGPIPVELSNLDSLELLTLYNNRFSGPVPSFMGTFPRLRQLILNNNKFTDMQDMSSVPIVPELPNDPGGLRIRNNRFTFDDILKNITKPTYIYAPQDSIFTDTLITRSIGQALTIDLGIDAAVIPPNIYIWHKAGDPLWTPPPGNNINSNQLIFNNLQSTDSGVYYVNVTNPGAPALTLNSRSITLDVQGCSVAMQPQITGPVTLCSGTATLQVSGNFAGYIWSNNAVSSAVTVNQTGTYTVTVTDSNTCTGTVEYTINGNTPAPAPTITGPVTLCPNIAVLQTGAFAQYNWSNNTTTAAIPVVQNGTFTVTVTNSNGCTGTAVHSVNGSSQPPAPAITGPSALCSGTATLQTTSNYSSYSWSNNAVSSSITVTASNTYEVTVTDNNGCTGTDTQTVGANVTAPTPSISITTQQCNTSATLSAGLYQSYLWSGGQNTPSITAATAGNYAVTVTDANGCTGTNLFNYTPAPVLNITTATINPVSCTVPDGSVDIEIITGTMPFQYNWSNSATTQDLINLGSGIYSVTVTDAANCTQVSTSTLTAPGAPVTTPQANGTTCQMDNGSISLSVTGVTGTSTYNWSNGATTAGINNLPPGQYTVTVTAPNMCTSEASATIAPSGPPPQPIIAGDDIICGNSTILMAEIFDQYLWSNGATTNNIAVGATGFYSVTVTDASGCTGTATHQITAVVTPPAPQITGPSALCGGTITLSLSNNYPQILWSGGATSTSVVVSTAGNYAVTVTDVQGCTGTDSYAVTNGNTLNIAITASGSTNICTGDTVTLGTAPVAGYSYQWQLDGTDIPGATNADLPVSEAGIYTLVVNQNGCTGTSAPQIIQVNPAPLVSLTAAGPLTFCEGGSVGLDGTASTGNTFQWLKGNVEISGATNPFLTVSENGVYRLRVTTGNCSAISGLVIVEVLPTPVITVDTIESVYCGEDNGSIGLFISNASGNVTYLWDNGSLIKNLKNVAPGTYQITVTGGNACTTTATFDIPDIPGPQPEISGPNEVKPGERVILNTSIQYASYLWSTTAVSPAIEVGVAGIYTVTVTDANDCTATASKTIKTNLEHFLDGIDQLLPRAFTPFSSPDKNDGFDPIGILIKNGWPIPDSLPIKMTVYARNGEAILKLDPYPKGGWSGDLVNPDLAEGAYYYVIEFIFPDRKKAIYKAVLNLIR